MFFITSKKKDMVHWRFYVQFLCIASVFTVCLIKDAQSNNSEQGEVGFSTIASHVNASSVYVNGKYTILRKIQQLPIPKAADWPAVITLPDLPSGDRCELVLISATEDEYYDQEELEVGVIKPGVECSYGISINGEVISGSSIRFYDLQGAFIISGMFIYRDINRFEYLNRGIGKNIIKYFGRYAKNTGKSFVCENTQNYGVMHLIDEHISSYAQYRVKMLGMAEPNIITGQTFSSIDWFNAPIIVNVRYYDFDADKTKSWEGPFSLQEDSDEFYYDPDLNELAMYRDDSLAADLLVTHSDNRINVAWRDPHRTDEYSWQIYITKRNVLRITIPFEDIFRFKTDEEQKGCTFGSEKYVVARDAFIARFIAKYKDAYEKTLGRDERQFLGFRFDKFEAVRWSQQTSFNNLRRILLAMLDEIAEKLSPESLEFLMTELNAMDVAALENYSYVPSRDHVGGLLYVLTSDFEQVIRRILSKMADFSFDVPHHTFWDTSDPLQHNADNYIYAVKTNGLTRLISPETREDLYSLSVSFISNDYVRIYHQYFLDRGRSVVLLLDFPDEYVLAAFARMSNYIWAFDKTKDDTKEFLLKHYAEDPNNVLFSTIPCLNFGFKRPYRFASIKISSSEELMEKTKLPSRDVRYAENNEVLVRTGADLKIAGMGIVVHKNMNVFKKILGEFELEEGESESSLSTIEDYRGILQYIKEHQLPIILLPEEGVDIDAAKQLFLEQFPDFVESKPNLYVLRYTSGVQATSLSLSAA